MQVSPLHELFWRRAINEHLKCLQRVFLALVHRQVWVHNSVFFVDARGQVYEPLVLSRSSKRVHVFFISTVLVSQSPTINEKTLHNLRNYLVIRLRIQVSPKDDWDVWSLFIYFFGHVLMELHEFVLVIIFRIRSLLLVDMGFYKNKFFAWILSQTQLNVNEEFFTRFLIVRRFFWFFRFNYLVRIEILINELK